MVDTTTTAQILMAAKDEDLKARLIAAAAKARIKSPHSFVMSQLEELMGIPLDAEGNTVASVYGYAVATYVPSPRPGENLAAVTATFLATALQKIGVETPIP